MSSGSPIAEGGTWVFPGDRLASTSSALTGVGVYADEATGEIRAALHGRVLIEDLTSSSSSSSSSSGKKSTVNSGLRINVVIRTEDFHPSTAPVTTTTKVIARDLVPRVGDLVLARVLRTNYNQAYVDILCLGEQPLPAPIKAVIRREDIRELEIDKVVVQEFLKPFDIVRAVIISLGDSKYYFLSTANKATSGNNSSKNNNSSSMIVSESALLGVVMPFPRSTDI